MALCSKPRRAGASRAHHRVAGLRLYIRYTSRLSAGSRIRLDHGLQFFHRPAYSGSSARARERLQHPAPPSLDRPACGSPGNLVVCPGRRSTPADWGAGGGFTAVEPLALVRALTSILRLRHETPDDFNSLARRSPGGRFSEAELINHWLTSAGLFCSRHERGHSLLCALREQTFDALVLDWTVPEMTGVDVLKHVRCTLQSSVPVLFISGRNGESGHRGSTETGRR